LKALGATDRQIRRIFMFMAERLVVRGLLIGNIVAIGLILLQACTHLLPLDPVNYYVDFVPVRLTWGCVIGLNVGVVGLSWLVLMLPAIIISRISPATTMRYEYSP
ncbi:MAG: FtsX-like permease family protein, partial [Muribaculaceae bacterium]|nr:FtsX-like permease family protein [Muribaculaceae bacterium]